MDDIPSWSDEYSVGIAVVDHAHRRLFDLYANLALAQRNGSHRVARRAADDLVSYVATHFAQGESLLAELPDEIRVPHLREHDRFERIVVRLNASGNTVELAPLVELLGTWLVSHVTGVDRETFKKG